MKSLMATILAAAALAVGGCDPANAQGRNDGSAPKTSSGQPATGTKANGTEPEPAVVVVIVSQGAPAAVEAIARARCDREKRCSNIGRGKKYPTEHACLHNVAAD